MIKEFTLGATKWEVEQIEKFENTSKLGEESYGERKIRLSKTWDGSKVSNTSMNQTLYHEVVHAILDTMGMYELSRNEEFVQQFSVHMQQFEQTKK